MRKPAPLRSGDLIGVTAPGGGGRGGGGRSAGARCSSAPASASALVRRSASSTATSPAPTRDRLADLQAIVRRPRACAPSSRRAAATAAGGCCRTSMWQAARAPSEDLRRLQRRDLSAHRPRAARRAGRLPRADGGRLRQQPAGAGRCSSCCAAIARSGTCARARSCSRAPAKGVIVGGCLSILVATLGTPYAIDDRGPPAVPRRRQREAVPHRPHAHAAAPGRASSTTSRA